MRQPTTVKVTQKLFEDGDCRIAVGKRAVQGVLDTQDTLPLLHKDLAVDRHSSKAAAAAVAKSLPSYHQYGIAF